MPPDGTSTSAGGWPHLAYEELPWTRGEAYQLASHRQRKEHAGTYNAVVPLAIAHRSVLLPGHVLAQVEDATTEIARFDVQMGGEIAPFSAVLLRSESAASSQIENLTASARAIAEVELGVGGTTNALQIVANVRAMSAAVALADRLSPATILEMHRSLMEAIEPDIAGRWRREQVWIGGTALGPHKAWFVPPHHSRVEGGIADLVQFTQRDDLPILAQAAVAHAQFETIHPFADGNGRTGRALLHSLLRNKGLTTSVTVPVSAGLLADTASYFAALDAYRTGDTTPIVVAAAQASLESLINGRQLVRDLRSIRRSWNDKVSARRTSAVWQVADLLVQHPVVNAKLVAEQLGIATANVYRYLEPLERAGVLTEFNDMRRNRAWRSKEILGALDAFAARVGRRTAPSPQGGNSS